MNEKTGMEHVAMQREGVVKMDYERPMEYGRTMPRMGTTMNLGREKIHWNQEIWNRIDQAVHDECQRTSIARRFLPLYGPVSPGELTIPSDTVVIDNVEANGKTLAVDEAATTPLIELFAEFTLTSQQVDREQDLMTAVTLATRAANLLCQAEDIVIFQGQEAISPGPKQHPLFKDNKVRVRSGPAGDGLLKAADGNPDIQVIEVKARPPKNADDPRELRRYGERTFAAVADAYSRLQSGTGLAQAHYGDYALVLHNEPYADLFAPLATTLIMPVDRVEPLMRRGVYGTGTLPAEGEFPSERKTTGMVVSLGGNTTDLVVGMDATTESSQVDTEGRYRFRIKKRFALRVKDKTAVIRLEFLPESEED